jgi:hypothetical protein
MSKRLDDFLDAVDGLAVEVEDLAQLAPSFRLHIDKSLPGLTVVITGLAKEIESRWLASAKAQGRRSPNKPALGQVASKPQREWNRSLPKKEGSA